MSIWFPLLPIEAANAAGVNSLIAHLGIEPVSAGEGALTARMAVDARTARPPVHPS